MRLPPHPPLPSAAAQRTGWTGGLQVSAPLWAEERGEREEGEEGEGKDGDVRACVGKLRRAELQGSAMGEVKAR